MRPRSRANDGASYTATRAVPLRQSLVFAVCPPDPLVRAAPRVCTGPKPHKGRPPGKLSDEQFLQIRSLFQFTSMTRPAIAEHMGVTLADVANVLGYKTRGHLDPTQAHADAALARKPAEQGA